MTARLPTPGADAGSWGNILNSFLSVSLNGNGTLKTSAISTGGGVTTSQVGSANGVAGLNASSLVPTTQLGNGTASSSNFLRGDGTWAVPSGGGSGTLAADSDVAIVSPGNGQVLTYDSTDNKWENADLPNATSSAPGLVQLDGDLGGTATSPSVVKIGGVGVPGSAPTGAGQVLTSTGASASAWQAPQAVNQQTVSVKTGSYALTTNDEVILANAAGGAITMTLPTAVSNQNLYAIKKIDSSGNTVTVATSGGQMIDGGSTALLKVQHASISVVSDGSNWYII